MKRFLSFTLIISIILSMCTFGLVASASSVYEAARIEEDFESGEFNTDIWRPLGNNKIEIAPIDSAAGSENLSYKLVDTNLDMTGSKNPFNVSTKAVLDFDFYFGELTSNYNFFAILGKDANGNTFESTGNTMLKYNHTNKTVEINQIGTWDTTVEKGAWVAPEGTAVKVTVDSWNNMRIVVDMKNLTFRVAVNGKVISDKSGTIDFKIPFSSYNCTSQPAMTNVRLNSIPNSIANAYYDNILYRELTSDIAISSDSAILNGEQNASVSALLNYEFTGDILPLTADDIILKNGSAECKIGNVVTEGNKLSIRLTSKLSYGTDYVLSLAKVMTSDGAYLPASEQTISFKTKPGISGKIIEEDFEATAIDENIWRKPGNNTLEIAPVDSAAGNGNYSYKLVDTTFDNNNTNAYLNLSNKAIFEFSILIQDETKEYPFFSMWGNDGNTSNTFETSGDLMLTYKSDLNTIGIRTVGTYTGTSVVTGADGREIRNDISVNVKRNDWNRIRVCVDMSNLTFRVMVNGELLSDDNGTSDFKIPFASYKCTSSPIIKKVSLKPWSNSTGTKYYDDIYYAELTEGTESISDITYSDGTAKVTIAKNNYSSIPDKLMFAVASYSDNELVALKMENIVPERGITKEYSVTLSDFNGGTVQKVFLWSTDFGNITPIKAIK